jgi:hypothetical protein
MRGEAILKMNVVITPTKEIRNRILTDLEFDVFQGALSRAHAQHSCKLMRQASCDKIRRKPFAWSEEYPYGVRSQRESNSKSWSFCELFGSSQKVGDKEGFSDGRFDCPLTSRHQFRFISTYFLDKITTTVCFSIQKSLFESSYRKKQIACLFGLDFYRKRMLMDSKWREAQWFWPDCRT